MINALTLGSDWFSVLGSVTLTGIAYIIPILSVNLFISSYLSFLPLFILIKFAVVF